tara:strand:+ start:817 stop:1404 length:588 start_codon:yes stop_codon:yes gene_type:complete
LIKKISIIFSFLILAIIVFFLFQNFLLKKNSGEKISLGDTNQTLENKNNLIKNLRYDVNFENNTKYNITADLSELIYEGSDEIVKMQKVRAVFIDKGGLPLIITSDNAVFNNTSYNTSFTNNVKIEYINNKMGSGRLLLDFENNVVIINDNIVYEGVQGMGEADNIRIDLITKDVQIFMNNSNNKVKIKSKKNNE